MTVGIEILRAGPLTTLQDAGRANYLASGMSASGPMDRQSYMIAGAMLEIAGRTAIEFTMTGMAFKVHGGNVAAAFHGGLFGLCVNSKQTDWPGDITLQAGDVVEITPGPRGNYGYVRFGQEIDVPLVLGSRATNLIAKLGGLEGRVLEPGDFLGFRAPTEMIERPLRVISQAPTDAPIRFIWGIHADQFAPSVREKFITEPFNISNHIDRMGARLDDLSGVFADAQILSLVSDSVVAGDIQILGDGTPIVLLSDHQPTGGYPRIATVISADLDRFAQLRPHQSVQFVPVTLSKAHAALMEKI